MQRDKNFYVKIVYLYKVTYIANNYGMHLILTKIVLAIIIDKN